MEPVVHIAIGVDEPINELGPFFPVRRGEEGQRFLKGRRPADYVQIGTADEHLVVRLRQTFDPVFRTVLIDPLIDFRRKAFDHVRGQPG